MVKRVKAKTSRRGKKQWRKKIDDKEIVEAVERENRESREVKVSDLKDEQLFQIDKSVSLPPSGGVRRRRVDREAARRKTTRAQAILEQGDAVQPLLRGAKRKQVQLHKKLHEHLAEKRSKEGRASAGTEVALRSEEGNGDAELDLWGSGAEGAERRDGGDPGPSGSGGEDFEDRARRVLRQEVVVRRRKALRVAPIPAVEVAVPGSSYNPTYEDHQDAVAAAVAQEMKKELRKELGPKVEKAVVDRVRHVPGQLPGVDDLVVDLSDSEQEEEDDGGAGGEASAGKALSRRAQRRAEKKTVAERNRLARKREMEREEEARRELKRQRRDIEHLAELERKVAEEEEQREVLRARHRAVKEERALEEPPRLGRHRFEDMPVQVMTTDDLSGSLRKIKPCAAVTVDRYKSLQKRGLVEITQKQKQKKGRRIFYESGARSDRAREEQAEIWALREKNRKMQRDVELETGAAPVRGL